MKPWIAYISVSLAMLMAPGLAADVLKTRDGRLISGTFRGATEQVIRFEVDGVVRTLPMTQVATLSFSEATPTGTPAKSPARAPTAAAASAAQTAAAEAPSTQTPTVQKAAPQPAAPAAASAPASVRVLAVPAGTKVRVRLSDSLDPRHAAEGDRFSALLETPLVAEGVTIAAANSKVYGVITEAQTSGPSDSRIKLELTELMLQGQTAKIVTGTHKVVDASGAVPANAAPKTDTAAVHAQKIHSGTHLEFRLLRPFEVRLR